MSEDSTKRLRVLKSLNRAIDNWTRRGNEQPLALWLDRELTRAACRFIYRSAEWNDCLVRILKVPSTGRTWSARLTGPLTRLIHATRWFARKDGSTSLRLDPPQQRDFAGQKHPGRPKAMVKRMTANDCGDWAPAMPVPTDWSGSKQGARRTSGLGWPAEEEFLAVDHGDLESDFPSLIVRSGPVVARAVLENPTSKYAATTVPRPRSWFSSSSGTLAEWSYGPGRQKSAQSALLLAEHSLALLSAVVDSLAASC